MKINVLGQKYTIKEMSDEEYPKLKTLEANGLFEGYSKELIIDKALNDPSPSNYENLELFKNKVVRHEIIHAFFHEAGLQEYVSNEFLVDWLAYQVPKMAKIFDDINVMK